MRADWIRVVCLIVMAVGATAWKVEGTCPAQWNAVGEPTLLVVSYAAVALWGIAAGDYVVSALTWCIERLQWARST